MIDNAMKLIEFSRDDLVKELMNRDPQMVYARITTEEGGETVEYMDYSGDEEELLWLCNLLIHAILRDDDEEED